MLRYPHKKAGEMGRQRNRSQIMIIRMLKDIQKRMNDLSVKSVVKLGSGQSEPCSLSLPLQGRVSAI